ncbi:hypothetical protein GLOIN_2v1770557 [Rhizophagus irregularis DAOM 181602=DAOM 197198]|nr:hypothetical protein GLOIN_2v1770557 [Rhizophagus irregularis DAOM 181602=DAOM 197198]
MPINSNTRNIRNAPLVSNTRNVPSAPATRSTANKSWKSNTKKLCEFWKKLNECEHSQNQCKSCFLNFVKINQKSWEPDTSFSKRSDAKDHINVPSLKGETKYIILLHDAAKKKHWPINYEYHSRNGEHVLRNSDEIIIYQETFCICF